MNNSRMLFSDIFDDFFEHKNRVITFNLHYDDGTRNVAITHPTTSGVNAATTRQILNECSPEELAKTFWVGFNTNHLFIHTTAN